MLLPIVKKLIPVLLIILIPWSFLCASPDDTWTGRDKLWHAGVSLAGYTLLSNFFKFNSNLTKSQRIAASSSAMIAAGVVKELTDNEFSWKDMGANAFGTGIGITINIKF